MLEKLELGNQLSKQEADINEEKSSKEAEDNEDDEPYEKGTFQYDPDKINIVTREPTIEQLLRRIDEEALDLAPDFQRHANIWKDDVKSRLIESIIIRIPLPAFYIDATNEDKWLVVDGLQRLSALRQFISENSLVLCDLEYLKTLDGKTYKDLERRYQRRILETQVTVYLIEKGTPPAVKYNIFKRINTGGLPLSPQELRHALNPGQAAKVLDELSKSKEFKRVIPLSNSRKLRMDDREFILGFLAFTLTPYLEYKNQTRDLFLSKALVKINNLPAQQIDSLQKKFKRAMTVAWEIFGKSSFRKIYKNNERKYPVSKALFESWSVNISQLSDEEINKLKMNHQQLIDKFIDRIEQDEDFVKAISQASNKVEYRFSTIDKIIKEVLQ